MAYIIKGLGTGTITSSGTTDCYVVPANRSALVTSVRLVNANAAAPTPTGNVLVKPSGAGSSSRGLSKVESISSTAMQLLSDPITLGQGDTIQVSIAPATTISIEYSIFGVERD